MAGLLTVKAGDQLICCSQGRSIQTTSFRSRSGRRGRVIGQQQKSKSSGGGSFGQDQLRVRLIEMLLTVNAGVDSLEFSIQGHTTVYELLVHIKVHQYGSQAFLELRSKLVVQVQLKTVYGYLSFASKIQEDHLEFGERLVRLYDQPTIAISGITDLVRVDVDRGKVLDHISSSDKAQRRAVVESGNQVLLYVSSSTIEYVEHLVLLYSKVVGVSSQLAFDLDNPAIESRIFSVRQRCRVRQLLRVVGRRSIRSQGVIDSSAVLSRFGGRTGYVVRRTNRA